MEEFGEDGIVELSDAPVVITELGHQFANLVCRDFDRNYSGNKKAGDLGEFSQDVKTVVEISPKIENLTGGQR